MPEPLISICIPAYERIEFLKRLLDSITIQTFRGFEVIITDDSKTDNVKTFVQNFNAGFPLYYYKNATSLGSPNNMRECASHANSPWVKIIHDDDWLASETALQQFADNIQPGVDFIFSGYNAYYENTGKYADATISPEKFRQLSQTPSLLFARNLIGTPSVLMMRKNMAEFYDTNLRWFIDIEYYLRIFTNNNVTFINRPLINISYNDTQISSYTKRNPSIVIPESLYILNKHGRAVASPVWAYDAWWRIFRNMDIKNVSDVERYADNIPIPPIVKNILAHQKLIPRKLLKIGAISKCCMSISYILNGLGSI